MTEKEVRKEQTVKGHFFLRCRPEGRTLIAGSQAEKGAAQSRPNIFIIPQMKKHVNIYLPENVVFGGLNEIIRTFLDSMTSCEKAGDMLFYKYKKDSSNQRILIRRRLSKYLPFI